MAEHKSPTDQSGQAPKGESQPIKEVELLRVMVTRDGQLVNAEWAIHPQLKDDLKPDELKEVSELMAQVTGIVGDRFSKVLSTAEPDQPGNA